MESASTRNVRSEGDEDIFSLLFLLFNWRQRSSCEENPDGIQASDSSAWRWPRADQWDKPVARNKICNPRWIGISILPEKKRLVVARRWSIGQTTVRVLRISHRDTTVHSDRVARRWTSIDTIYSRLYRGNRDVSWRVELESLQDVFYPWHNPSFPHRLATHRYRRCRTSERERENSPADENIRANSMASCWHVRFSQPSWFLSTITAWML